MGKKKQFSFSSKEKKLPGILSEDIVFQQIEKIIINFV
jgi:hypothetical protein